MCYVSRLRVNLVVWHLLELEVKVENLGKMEVEDCQVTQETLNKVKHQTVPDLHHIHQ